MNSKLVGKFKLGEKFIRYSGISQVRILKLISVFCCWCGAAFHVCRSCWRGQKYCSDDCRKAANLKSHRESQRRYRQTEKGKKAHRFSENRRRERKKESDPKNMDDKATTLPSNMPIMDSPEWKPAAIYSKFQNRCRFCGRFGEIVSQFSRRGYGKRNE